jgi:hypothetical protein
MLAEKYERRVRRKGGTSIRCARPEDKSGEKDEERRRKRRVSDPLSRWACSPTRRRPAGGGRRRGGPIRSTQQRVSFPTPATPIDTSLQETPSPFVRMEHGGAV